MHVYIVSPTFAAVVLTDVVPKCDYYPSYAYVHKVKRFTGVYDVNDSFVYPDDHTELDVVKRYKQKAAGNPIIDQSVSCYIMSVVSVIIIKRKIFDKMIPEESKTCGTCKSCIMFVDYDCFMSTVLSAT